MVSRRDFIKKGFFTLGSLLLSPLTYGQREKHKTRLVKVILDPGHGFANKTPGIMDWGDAKYVSKFITYREADLTLGYANRVKEMLDETGRFLVYLTRYDNETPIPVENRPSFANEKRADLFVSIHVNNRKFSNRDIIEDRIGNGFYSGFEILWENARSENFAKVASKTFSEIMPIKQNRFAKGNWHMLQGLKTPGILVEGFYIVNQDDVDKVLQPDLLLTEYGEMEPWLAHRYIPYFEASIAKSIENYVDKYWYLYPPNEKLKPIKPKSEIKIIDLKTILKSINKNF